MKVRMYMLVPQFYRTGAHRREHVHLFASTDSPAFAPDSEVVSFTVELPMIIELEAVDAGEAEVDAPKDDAEGNGRR